MTESPNRQRSIDLDIPIKSLVVYLHSSEAWLAAIPGLELAEFQTLVNDGTAQSTQASAIVSASVGKFDISASVESNFDPNQLAFSGEGKVAKIAPFSLNGVATPNGAGSTVTITPVLDKLPNIVQALVGKIEGKLLQFAKTKLEAYHQSS